METDGTNSQNTTMAGFDKEGTPKEIFTRGEVEKMLQEVRTSAMADVGRVTQAAREGIKKATENVSSRYQSLLAEQASDFEELVKDNPDTLTVIRERASKRELAAEKTRLEQELTERDERLKEYQKKEEESIKNSIVNEIASRFGVDANKLIKLSKFTDGSKETIEDLAKDFPTTNLQSNPSSLDSNRNNGLNQTEAQIRQAYIANPNDPKARDNYMNWRRTKGI